MTTRDSLGGAEHRPHGSGSGSSSLSPSIKAKLRYRLRGLDRRIGKLRWNIALDKCFVDYPPAVKRRKECEKLDQERKKVRNRLKGRVTL